METDISALAQLQQLLRSTALNTVEKKAFVGFDGFIDKIKRAVKEKQNARTVYFNYIRDFADRILMASNKSGQIQMDTQQVKFGGNAPILSNTLAKLGVKTFCFGTMGYPEPHDIFSGMDSSCEKISLLDPGLSDAIEFIDGKLIFSELQVFQRYTWEHIKRVAGLERISKAVTESSLIAFVDWANLPHANDIWYGVLEDVIRPLKRKDFFFLFDLCDPSKKRTEEIQQVLQLISSFSPYGKVTLGLNENETLKIWAAISAVKFSNGKEKLPPVVEAGDFLYRSMNIHSLLVHPIDRSIAYGRDETIELKGRLVTKPKVLTGGGDNLNAGYCLGLLSGFTLAQSMLLGMAASGSYIENGVSPNRQGIIEYLDVWMRDLRKETSTQVPTHQQE